MMRKQELRETLDALETFILLKRQNLVIYAWMELKKRDRRLVGFSGSRARSIFSSPASLKNSSIKSRNQKNLYCHIIPSKSSHSSPYKEMDQRFVTQHIISNSRQGNLDAINSRLQGSRYDQIQRDAISRRSIFGIRNGGLDLEDNDEFEEIVIKRLAKLEENISKMMQQKKMKEQKNGSLVSTPLAKDRKMNRKDETILNKNGQGSHLLHRKKEIFGFFSDDQQTPKDTIYNLKYIPVVNHKNAHIQKIRQLIDSKEEDNMMNNIDYFFDSNARKEIGSSVNGQSRLYTHRYQHSAADSNRIHYLPNNIDIQTVIEPRSRHFRKQVDKAFSPIRIDEEEIKSLPKSNNSCKHYLNKYKFSSVY